MNNQLPQLILGDVIVPVPVIQGGMGVGVSRSRLAGAVAKEGGIGVISTAQIGYDEENFEKNPAECNRRAIIKHIAQAKEIAGGNGLVGVNIMVALKHYRQHIETAVEAGADVIICGAGLPADLPGIAQNYAREHGKKIPKLMPIVSSARAAGIILKMWDHHYHTVPDCIIVEGPMAGGHLGFQESVLENIENIDFDAILCGVIDSKKPYEEKYTKKIPVAAAGGIFDRQDIDHVLSLGADAVQIASRFVVTKECDASDAYKRAYIEAGKACKYFRNGCRQIVGTIGGKSVIIIFALFVGHECIYFVSFGKCMAITDTGIQGDCFVVARPGVYTDFTGICSFVLVFIGCFVIII